MIELPRIEICTTKIGSLVHASCGHDPNQLIEELILLSNDEIQAVGKVVRSLILELIS